MRIYSESDAAPWVRRCKAWLRMNGFAGLDNVRVELRDMYCLGQALCEHGVVLIKRGKRPIVFCSAIVHEMTHMWLYARGHQADGFDGEGAASLIEYRFLTQIGTDEALREARALLATGRVADGVDYGLALQAMLRRAG